MPKARSQQVSLQDTCYYHCVSRCVRRSFLCGQDPYSGKSYEHRRQWVEDRLLQLAEVFAISVCAFAVMSNHTHVVLCIEPEQVEEWDTTNVIQRWHRLYCKSVPGLFFVGEVMDVTGWLGGFNFQWAWSSGYVAGQNA